LEICLGFTALDRAWGGGNRAAKIIKEAAEQMSASVVTSLDSDDIDIIIIFDPRTRHSNVPFSFMDAVRYRERINPRCLIVQRINECDERKGTHFVNRQLRAANYYVNYTVFVGSWLKDLNLSHRRCANYTVILNGADRSVFFPNQARANIGSMGRIKIVTHHWSSNKNKGFDVYKHLDDAFDIEAFASDFQMTYVGNLPAKFKFRNCSVAEPADGLQLRKILVSHDIYLTASLFEPGGNHQNEGALCGLPLVYRRSGCMPEYCDGYGIGFDGPNDVIDALYKLRREFSLYKTRIRSYPNHDGRVKSDWKELFSQLLRSPESYVLQSESRFKSFVRDLYTRTILWI